MRYDLVIAPMEWSYSRLTAYEDCPYAWLQKYIFGVEGKSKFFAEYGSFMHSILQLYLTGKLKKEQLTTYYLTHFLSQVSAKAPTSKIYSSYFEQGRQYLKVLSFPQRNILRVEDKMKFNFAGYPFVGVVDVVSEDENGKLYIDVSPSDRDKVYDYIINRFGQEKTAFILAIGTIKSKGCIDEICRALSVKWNREHQTDERLFKKALAALKDDNVEIAFGDARDGCGMYAFDEHGNLLFESSLQGTPRGELLKVLNKEYARIKVENEKLFAQNPWAGKISSTIKKEFEIDEATARKKYPEVFYYYDGLLDVAISQSMHPAGIVASPVTLADNYGTFYSDGKVILQIDMECVHEVSLVKYDILGLKNIEIIKDAYALIGESYPNSHEINWNDEAVWADMLKSPIGIFQFEGDFAFSMLRQYKPHSIFDMSLITAALRPSGASYRDDLMKHKPHKNPSTIIDELLKDNNGYLIYQEDVIKFLQQICGFSGSDADNTRRAIGRKDEERLKKALPQILEGYCEKSPQPREVAEQEAKEFLQIIEDASSYMFG